MNLPRTKPVYLWALGITVLLSIWALLSPAPEPQPALVDLPQEARLTPRDAATTRRTAFEALSLDADAARVTPSQVDIFADRRSPQATATIAGSTISSTAPIEVVGPSLPPPPPPLNVQFAGRFRAPEGRPVVYLRDGDRFLVAKVGDVVSSGYQLTALLGEGKHPLKPDDNASRIVALRFFHAPSRHTETLMLPPEVGAP